LRSLLAQLATHTPSAAALVLEAIAVGRESTVTLVGTPGNRVAFTRRTHRAGLQVTDAPSIVVNPGRGTATVGNPWPDVDLDALSRFARGRGEEIEAGALAWGEYPIRELQVQAQPSVITLLGEFGSVRHPGSDAGANWDLLVELGSRVPIVAPPVSDHG
jgi:hypothetical protein